MRARPIPGQYARLPWLIVVMTVAFLAIGVIAARLIEGRFVEAKGESLALAAAEVAHKLDLLIAERAGDIRLLASAPVVKGGRVAETHDLLNSFQTIDPLYLFIGVTDAEGRFVAATNHALIGMDMSKSPWFRAARRTNTLFVGDVAPSEEVDGVDAISFTAPITHLGTKFQGVVTTRVGLPLLEKVMSQTLRTFQEREDFTGRFEYRFATVGGSVFVDSERPNNGNLNRTHVELSSALRDGAGDPGYIEETHPHRHVPIVTGYAFTRGPDARSSLKWTVLLHTDRDALVAPIWSTLWKLAAAWVVFWLPILGILLWSADRLKKEQELGLTAELQYRELVEQAEDIIYRTDARGYFTYVNPTVTRATGYAPEELIGKHFTEFIRPDSRAAAKRFLMRQFLRKRPSAYHEFPAIAKGGGEFWISQNVQPSFENGRVVGFQAVARDITARKQTEKRQMQLIAELAKSRNRFEMFFRQTPSAISITTIKEGRFLDLNRQAEVLTGYSREELIGRTTLEMNLYVTPADRPKLVERLKETGLLHDVEREIRTKSGEIRTAVFSLVPIHMGSEPCLLSIAHDITERKRAEQRLHERSRQQAIEAELGVLAVTIQDLPHLLSTTAGLISNALEVNYCEVLELIPNGTDLRLCASAGWRGDAIGQVRALETDSPAHATLNSNKPVVRTLPKDSRFGGPKWLHEHGSVTAMSVSIPGKDGAWGVLGVYTTSPHAFSRDDVNFLQTVASILATAIERMQAENVLRSANQSLRLLSRQLLQVQEDDRRAIARDLHDEIGQALTAIKLNVERAQRTADGDTRAHIMRDCAQITEHVLGQVRNLSLDLHPSILDDLGLAYALKWYTDRQAERAGLKVQLTADPSLPRLPQDIEITCFRIAQEALTNVVRHARAELAIITLKRGGSSVELSIEDNGIGFAVDQPSAPANGRSSVGLASMQERAKLLGGTIKITSTPQYGTTVVATLPLPVASPAGMATEEAGQA